MFTYIGDLQILLRLPVKSTTIKGGSAMNHKNKLIALENDHMFSSVMQKEDAAIKILQTIFPEHEIDRVEYLDDFDSMDPQKEQTVQKFIQIHV